MADEKYTEEELAELTEEEREAILAEDDGDDDDAGADTTDADEAAAAAADDPAADKGGEDDDPDADPDADPDDDKKKGAKEDDPAGDDDPNAGGDDDPDADQAAAQQRPDSAPPLVADIPEDYDDQVKAVTDAKQKLIDDFDEGEITAREYHQQLEEQNRKERELERIKDRAEMASQMAEQQQVNDWKRTVSSFLNDHPQYKPPADENDSNPLYYALDAEVRRIGGADPDMPPEDVLAEAHKRILKATGQQEADPAADKDPAPRKPAPRKPVDAPPNLGKVPAADVDDIQGGKYAKLDRLAETDPLAYEDALAQLPEAEQEHYLKSQ